jgi:hypothetical protein
MSEVYDIENEEQNGEKAVLRRQVTDNTSPDSTRSSDVLNERNGDYVEIHEDVYNMFFLSRVGGQAFYYAAYVWCLKMALYSFLAMDAYAQPNAAETSSRVLAAQFLMLPVAVAMQQDLIATYYLIANLKYCPTVKVQNPDATKWKFHFANTARGIDGVYSLLVNFVILIKATEVLSLFLNFAALQFLTSIDDIALTLALNGYLTERLEEVAQNVKCAKLPKKRNEFYKTLDSILFLTTYAALLITWAVYKFAP